MVHGATEADVVVVVKADVMAALEGRVAVTFCCFALVVAKIKHDVSLR